MALPPALAPLSGSPLVTGWEEAQAARPPALDWLQPSALREAALWSGLPLEALEEVGALAVEFAACPDLAALAWNLYYGLYIGGNLKASRGLFPETAPVLDGRTGTFYLIVALSGVAPMRARHRRLGVPDPVSRLTASDIAVWAREYRTRGLPSNDGFHRPSDPMPWGLHVRGLAWILRSLTGDILRVGRLQFIHAPFRPPFTVHRHRQTGEVVIAPEPGMGFDRDGWRVEDLHRDLAWRSEQRWEGSDLVTTVISPEGRGRPDPVRLPRDGWTRVLAPQDPILEIHIPEDGPMDFTACGASFREIARHYRSWYPDREFRAFSCGSWFLDPQYQDILPAGSNIVRFQKAGRLYPLVRGSGRSGFFRIFEHDDLSRLPRDTSLRRGYLSHLERGGGWWGGGCLVFPDEIDRWAPPR